MKAGYGDAEKIECNRIPSLFSRSWASHLRKNSSNCGAKYKLADVADFIHFAIEKMQKDNWSPDAICGYAKMHQLFDGKMVCTKTLYNYIDMGALLVKNIDLPLKVRRSTRKIRTRKNKKILGKSIEERPTSIQKRTEFGHWEIDTVLGSRTKGSSLLTLTERQTRMEHIFKIDHKSMEGVDKAIQALKARYGEHFPAIFKSITSDKGSEFRTLAQSIDCEQVEIYYTHPYTSCERGTNERHNSLIRRFKPKGKSIDDIHDTMILYVENWCNTLPRKILNYRTPQTMFQEAVKNVC
jgi:transposase, IS30 family